MADLPIVELLRADDDDSIVRLIRRDLLASDRFKRDYWNSQKVQLRRRAYEGDPQAYDDPYDPGDGRQSYRPVNNWMFRQINHKVGKLCRTAVRLNTRLSSGADDDDIRLMLEALKQRILRKAREANWSQHRRRMLLDAAKTGLGIRCIGLVMEDQGWRIGTFPVKAEEFHMDPTAESIHDATWVAWRRWVLSDKLVSSLSRHPEVAVSTGSYNELTLDSRSLQISLSDDQILARISGSQKGGAFHNVDSTLVTDYWRRDNTIDINYGCSRCGNKAAVSREKGPAGTAIPKFQCQTCGYKEKKKPDNISQSARYPFGRQARLLGAGTVDYNGPNKLRLKDKFPFVHMVWYDGEFYPGYSEVEQLQSPQLQNNVALQMLMDHAFNNTHPKAVVAADGIVKGWNSNPSDVIELSPDAMAAGGIKSLSLGEVGESTKILLSDSVKNTFLLAGNSPESQGQAPETIRSGIGIRSVISASDVGLYLTNDNMNEAEARFYRMVRDICAMVDSPATIMVPDAMGNVIPYPYTKEMMKPDVEIEVLTDRDIDEEREQIFSRALDLKMIGDPNVDFQMLEDISGIPADILRRAHDRAQSQGQGAPGASPPGVPPGMTPPGATAASPPPGIQLPGMTTNGNGIPGPMRQRLLGAQAPRQMRPPARSRSPVQSTPFGGGGNPPPPATPQAL